jgi:hypothetical protein
MSRSRYVVLSAATHLAALLFLAGVSLYAQDLGENDAAPLAATPKPATPFQMPSARERFHRYLLDAYGPAALLGAAITAGTDQPANAPPEWKQGAAGFERRFGSRFGQFAVAETARFGLATMLHEDTTYRPCECRAVLPRLGHALLASFTARSADGHRVFSVPDLAAPYAGGLVATGAWYPARYGPKDGIRLGTWAIGIHTGVNIVREFLPRGR